MNDQTSRRRVVVIGAGLAGLAAAYDLAKAGLDVTVLEKEPQAGGLAASFDVQGAPLEKFYHHLFVNDADILGLVSELGGQGDILVRRSRTGIYHQGRIYRLSTPWDLLKFSPLGLRDRFRMGRMVLKARHVRDWRRLENLTAEQWLCDLCGPEVYRTVWRPLLYGKFGVFAPEISAVWFWNKLKLRGSSRDSSGAESLIYFRGGFESVVRRLTEAITRLGGRIMLNAEATGIDARDGKVAGVQAGGRGFQADAVIATGPLPLTARLLERARRSSRSAAETRPPQGGGAGAPPPCTGAFSDEFMRRLSGIQYLANLCLVLELDRPLSDIYWLNVCDETFPYVGIIEHTNFEPPETYAGRHIVYLSKYLSPTDPMYTMDADSLLDMSCRRLEAMFPAFRRKAVLAHHLWRADFSQHIVVRNYGRLIPPCRTPLGGVYLCSMAQIYPEDRGTNYAVRQGRAAARTLMDDLLSA